jgi:hypothetical protein
MLLEAFTDAPAQARCPTCNKYSPRHTPLMDIQVLQWHDAAHPRSRFFVNYRYRVDSDKIVFTLIFGCEILSVMTALNEANPRLDRWNRVPVDTSNSLLNFCKKKFRHDRHITTWSHLFWFPSCGGIGGLLIDIIL